MAGFNNLAYTSPSNTPPEPRQRIPETSGVKDDGTVCYRSSWAGMSMAAVEDRSSHVFWRVFRLVALVFVLIIWFAILIACISLLAMGSGKDASCNSEVVSWLDTAVGYQIYTPSFQDSNGDGIGDIQGIISRLDYLEHLGIDSIWLGPIFESLNEPLWFDVTDFTAVDGVFGTMEDFQELVNAVHAKHMKLVLEFLPSYTSHQHAWFQQSRQGVDNEHSYFYIWADGINDGPPNEMLSRSDGGGPAWEYDSTRRQWYRHTYRKELPDLNYGHPAVVSYIQDALRFWLDKGIDGLYMRHVDCIFDSGISEMDDIGNYETISSGDNKMQDWNAEMLDVITGWGKLIDDYPEMPKESIPERTRLLVVDVGTNLALAASVYSNDSLEVRRANFAFNNMFSRMAPPLNGHSIRQIVQTWTAAGPAHELRHWAMGTSDVSRLTTRYGTQFTKAVMLLLLMLPGSPVIYYGDEIGMTDGNKPNNSNGSQIMNSDRELSTRLPMQWSSDINGGFTTGLSQPWISVGANASKVNVELQMQNSSSILAFVQQTLRFRRNNTDGIFGSKDPALFRLQTTYNEVFAFTREAPVSNVATAVFAAVNIGRYALTENFESRKDRIPSIGVVVLGTDPSRAGESINFNHLFVKSGEGIVIQYVANEKPTAFSEPYTED